MSGLTKVLSKPWTELACSRAGMVLRLAAVVLLPIAAFTACGDDNDDNDGNPTSSTPGTSGISATPEHIEGELSVFAAASLTEAYRAIEDAFEAAYQEVDVLFNFAGSSALATQIAEGAPADVFASANVAQMEAVLDAGHADEQFVFATNVSVVIAPADNDKITEFGDLANDGYSLVLAGEEVPIGQYAREIFAKASGPGGLGPDFADRALANLRSNESDVRAVLAKVQLGEADAGIVYATDVASIAGDVRVIDIPGQFNVVAQYPIATLTGASNPAAAEAFVDFVLSDDGQAILAEFGFGRPGD